MYTGFQTVACTSRSDAVIHLLRGTLDYDVHANCNTKTGKPAGECD